jgi:hypothetical protein
VKWSEKWVSEYIMGKKQACYQVDSYTMCWWKWKASHCTILHGSKMCMHMVQSQRIILSKITYTRPLDSNMETEAVPLSEVCQWILQACISKSFRVMTIPNILDTRGTTVWDASWWHCLWNTEWQSCIQTLTLHSVGKLCNVNAE